MKECELKSNVESHCFRCCCFWDGGSDIQEELAKLDEGTEVFWPLINGPTPSYIGAGGQRSIRKINYMAEEDQDAAENCPILV